MGRIRCAFALAVALAVVAATARAQQAAHHWAIVLHGGAGVIERANMDPKTEAVYRAALTEAIEAGAKVLDKGGSSLDAVEAAIRIPVSYTHLDVYKRQMIGSSG